MVFWVGILGLQAVEASNEGVHRFMTDSETDFEKCLIRQA